MRIRHVLHLGIKELRGLVRDPLLAFLVLYAFTVDVYVSSNSMPETLSKAAIAIVDEDASPLSRSISAAFYPPYFLPPSHITQPEMDARMDAGLDTFALDIPPDFQRDLLAGNRPVLQLNMDATRMSQAFTGSGYVQQIVTAEVAEYLARHRGETEMPVELSLRSRFNPELNVAWFGAITNVISAVTMLSIILTGAALIREREHATVEHLLVMPVTALEIMLAKIWAMGLVVLVASAVSLTLVVQAALDVPIAGSLPLFFLGAMLHLFATTSLGILLATFAGSMPQFGMLMLLVLLPLQVLSGGMTPRESMPEVLQKVMLVSPDTHYIELAQGILFRGAGLDFVWPHLLALLAIGAVLFLWALSQFRAFLR